MNEQKKGRKKERKNERKKYKMVNMNES